jgi:hypothetical protein
MIAEKVKSGSAITLEEEKTLAYTFGFFGERGLDEVKELTAGNEKLQRAILERIHILREKKHLPISCAKIRNDYEICLNMECVGDITPIRYVFKADPNVNLIQEIHLSDLGAKHLNQYVYTNVYISGIGNSFSVPYKLKVTCLSKSTQVCENCPYYSGKTITVNDLRNQLNEPYLILEFVKISKQKEQNLLQKYVRQFFETNAQCPLLEHREKPRLHVDIVQEKTVTPLIVCPGLDEITVQDVKARENLRKRVYLMGIKRSVARKGHLIGPVLKHPRTGMLTILGTHFYPTEFDIESFKIQPEQLKIAQEIMTKPEAEIIDVTSNHVCLIYGREKEVLANLLAYHSPLYIIWKGERIPGWVHIANFGDTTVGKSQIPRKIRAFTRLGVYVVVETSARTGLLYFIDQSKEGHILGFGELVLADRTLAIIDGYDRMDPQEKAEFRESYRQGFLKVRRVVSGSAPMRTRLISCENVKNPLRNYLYPCRSLLENYDKPSIARIDLAVPYSQEDVSTEQIYKRPSPKPEWFYDFQEALTLNILLTWSRKPEQIRFTPEAETAILEHAKMLDEEYGVAELPLVSKDFDKKLSKLSASYAAFRHSYDENLNLIITKEHVNRVVQLIEELYASEGMRLDQYAEIMKHRSTLSKEEYEEIKEEIEKQVTQEKIETGPGRPAIPITEIFLDEILIRGSLTASEIAAIAQGDLGTQISQKTIGDRMKIFKKHHLIVTSGRRGYVLTAKGNQFLRRYKREKDNTKIVAAEETENHAPKVARFSFTAIPFGENTPLCNFDCSPPNMATHYCTLEYEDGKIEKYPVCQECKCKLIEGLPRL